jgi:hypothetical protein
MQCPICECDAEEIEKGSGDYMTLRCPEHEFEVSDTVLKERLRAPEQWARALERATKRAGVGDRPKILSYDFDS